MKKTLILTIVTLSFLWGTMVSATIFSYSKVTDKYTTYTVIEPDYKEGNPRITELCVIDGVTYIFVPDTVTLPKQPAQIVLSKVIPDEAFYLAVEAASPHVQLINQRVDNDVLAIAEGESQKRALGYIPIGIKTPKEKVVAADTALKKSVWWQKTDVQLNTYIDNNWDNPVKRKTMFKKLVRQVADLARRGGWDD